MDSVALVTCIPLLAMANGYGTPLVPARYGLTISYSLALAEVRPAHSCAVPCLALPGSSCHASPQHSPTFPIRQVMNTIAQSFAQLQTVAVGLSRITTGTDTIPQEPAGKSTQAKSTRARPDVHT